MKYKEGDLLAYEYKNKGYLILKIIAISDMEDLMLYHLRIFDTLYKNIQEAEKIDSLNKITNFIPHVAITKNQFEKEDLEIIKNEEVFMDEKSRYRNWLIDWNHHKGEYFDLSLKDLLNSVV
ncbi:MAG TPA: hypothetical protein VKN74_07200 [Candidatus Mcinerneyibacterium sp.]|nr:hypothetical protein [Candidatus Mcinerneyibacterium sp.]